MSKPDDFMDAAQVVWDAPDLASLHAKSIQALEWQKQYFPEQSDFALEVQATTAFREAARLMRKIYKTGTPAYGRLMRSPDGQAGGLLAWAQPDWNLVLYCAKLLRYIALAGQYEMRAFTPEQRLARDVREKRHKALMEQWPVVEW